MKFRVLLYCVFGGAPMVISAMGTGHPLQWLSAGIVLAAGFVPVALFGPRRFLAQFGVIAPVLLIVGAFCTLSEAYFFTPGFRQHAITDLVGASVLYLIVAVVLAFLARVLKLNRQSEHAVTFRSSSATTGMLLLSGVSYVIYYLIFGAITYQYFTKVYYPNAAQQAAQIGVWFWLMEFGRGLLMTLGVLPVICTLRMSRIQSAIAVGALLWIAGGLSPLLMPNEVLGTAQRIIHIVEILTQNAPLGITAVLLLRPRQKQASPQAGPVVAAIS
jgi:hypothetical protein